MWISDEVREVLSPFSIDFNGIELTEYFFPKQDKGRGLPEREITMITVPGRPGGLITGERTPARFISQEILIACESAKELRKKLEELSEVLHTDKPASLQFEDEEDRTYYAMYAGAQEGYEIEGFYTATINFICPDPYKYAPPTKIPFTLGEATVYNYGTVEATPTVRATILEDITYMDVFNDKGYMRIGQPVKSGEVSFNPKVKLLNETFSTTVGWTSAGTVVDDGVVSGVMSGSNGEFLASDFGVQGGSIWHGPSLKKSVPGAPVSDFEVEWKLNFKSPVMNRRGKVDLYVLDDQSDVVAKMSMKRASGGASGNHVEIRVGDTDVFYHLVNYAGDNGTAWNEFDGILRMGRKDNVWYAYVAKVNPTTGKHTARHYRSFVDTARLYMKQLAQVQVYIARDANQNASVMRLAHLDVYQLNTEPAKTPVIAVAGDEIELDFKESLISVNGEPRPDLKDFGATFFKLPKGKTHLLIEPLEKLTAEIEMREAFR